MRRQLEKDVVKREEMLFLTMPCFVWDLSSLTRDQACSPCFWSMES